MASINGLQTKSRALFTVAKGSDISPRELASAGFLMVDGQFYPADIKQIQQRPLAMTSWCGRNPPRS